MDCPIVDSVNGQSTNIACSPVPEADIAMGCTYVCTFSNFAGMDSTRQNKVARLLQKELGLIFLQEGRKWVGAAGMITVTMVRMTPDLGLAKVYLSVFNVADKALVVKGINEAAHEYRRMLGTKIRHQVRHIPDLVFYLDDSLDYAERIDNLLSGLDPS